MLREMITNPSIIKKIDTADNKIYLCLKTRSNNKYEVRVPEIFYVCE
jgi:hypothetical protein